MVTIKLGRWQVAALAASVFVLVLVAVLLGVLIASAALTGGGAGTVVASAPPGGAAPAPAAAGGGGAAGGDLAAKARNHFANSFEVRHAMIETADHAGDAVGDAGTAIIDPVARGASAAAKRFLPKWMSGQVALSIEKASFYAQQKVAYGAEDMVENAMGDVVQGGPGGSAAPPPPRQYAIELGRFATSFNAESFAAAAAQRGVSATVDYAPQPGQNGAYAVRTGRYAAAEDASAALDALARSSGVSGTVVTLAEPGGRSAP